MDLLELIVWALMAYGCYYLAKKKNYNTNLAIVLGVLFGIFALIGYLIVGEKKDSATTN